MLITSTKNEIVKSVRRLRDRSARRESGQHLIEGERLVFDALEAGIVPETLFIEQGRTDFEARANASSAAISPCGKSSALSGAVKSGVLTAAAIPCGAEVSHTLRTFGGRGAASDAEP